MTGERRGMRAALEKKFEAEEKQRPPKRPRDPLTEAADTWILSTALLVAGGVLMLAWFPVGLAVFVLGTGGFLFSILSVPRREG